MAIYVVFAPGEGGGTYLQTFSDTVKMLKFAEEFAKYDAYVRKQQLTVAVNCVEDRAIYMSDKDCSFLYKVLSYDLISTKDININSGDVSVLVRRDGLVEISDGINSMQVAYEDYTDRTLLDILSEFGELTGGL